MKHSEAIYIEVYRLAEAGQHARASILCRAAEAMIALEEDRDRLDWLAVSEPGIRARIDADMFAAGDLCGG